MSKRRFQINKLCLSAMFMAIGWLMPFITGQIPEFGNMLCPMHIPVLIAGFVLGPWYGAMIGFLLPLTRFFIFGMPVLYPIGIGMMFELAVYGFISGLLYRILHSYTRIPDVANIYITLIAAMIFGRCIWGVSRAICGLFPNNSFTWMAFLSGAFLTAWPGILLQLFLIPAIIYCLSRANLLQNFMEFKIQPNSKKLIQQLQEQSTKGEGCFIIAIDGMSGSGKTTLAEELAKKLDANLVHMDDFYLPKNKRPEHFLDIPGSHMDFVRIKTEVLDHIHDSVVYKKFNCASQEFSSEETLESKKVWIIEGSYSLHPSLGKYYQYAIFKKIEDSIQQKRIQHRNPTQYDDFMNTWIPLENRYFKEYQIEEHCDTIF
ncbi:MAG: ECF transporter S component [Anaeroplasmataceae bacterium]|nr:ECF transporter S component [Anaeroplasmataceae bacterium]